MVSTEDIPYLSSLLRKATATQDTAAAAAAAAAAAGVGPQSEAGNPVPMFDPDVVELNATMLLRFLQVRFFVVALAAPPPGVRCDTEAWFSLVVPHRCVLPTPTHVLLS